MLATFRSEQKHLVCFVGVARQQAIDYNKTILYYYTVTQRLSKFVKCTNVCVCTYKYENLNKVL